MAVRYRNLRDLEARIPACAAGREDSGHGSPTPPLGRTEKAHREGCVLLCQPEAGGGGLNGKDRLLKEGTGDAVGWALRACSYKTKTEASQQRRSRHTLQGVFLVFVFAPFSFSLFDSSSLRLFVSLTLRLFVSLSLRLTRQFMGINGETFLVRSAPFLKH